MFSTKKHLQRLAIGWRNAVGCSGPVLLRGAFTKSAAGNFYRSPVSLIGSYQLLKQRPGFYLLQKFLLYLSFL
jgi:hypothetical protein